MFGRTREEVIKLINLVVGVTENALRSEARKWSSYYESRLDDLRADAIETGNRIEDKLQALKETAEAQAAATETLNKELDAWWRATITSSDLILELTHRVLALEAVNTAKRKPRGS